MSRTLKIVLPLHGCPELANVHGDGADHCWHNFSQAVFSIANPPHTEICCHCGRYGRFEFRHGDPGHGPHHPDPGSYALVKVMPSRAEDRGDDDA